MRFVMRGSDNHRFPLSAGASALNLAALFHLLLPCLTPSSPLGRRPRSAQDASYGPRKGGPSKAQAAAILAEFRLVWIGSQTTPGLIMLYFISISSTEELLREYEGERAQRIMRNNQKTEYSRYLCLCNPLTGDCTFLPYPEFKEDTCVLVTGYDFDSPNDDPGVRILAMRVEAFYGHMIAVKYQLSTPTTAGAGKTATWGAVVEVEIKRCLRDYTYFDDAEVICRGAIHWLCKLINGHKCVLALHMGTSSRTWTTMKLPEQCQQGRYYSNVLAVSRDGRITLVHRSTCDEKMIHVWVHIDGDQWTLQRVINVLSNLDRLNEAFGHRSGWLLVEVVEQEDELLIDVERGLYQPIMHNAKNLDSYEFRIPYEMDWSTYLSKMKHF